MARTPWYETYFGYRFCGVGGGEHLGGDTDVKDACNNVTGDIKTVSGTSFRFRLPPHCILLPCYFRNLCSGKWHGTVKFKNCTWKGSQHQMRMIPQPVGSSVFLYLMTLLMCLHYEYFLFKVVVARCYYWRSFWFYVDQVCIPSHCKWFPFYQCKCQIISKFNKTW